MESNRALWDEWTKIHIGGDFYDVDGFRQQRPGRQNRVHAYELEEIGDVRDLDVLHLQCHFGLDTLSLARLGARVTGVDFSPEAIAQARQLADEVGLDATFVCSNVYDVREHVDGAFDLVYTSRGVLGWLPDIETWAEIVAHYVKPGGLFYLSEIHPIAQVWDESSPGRFVLKHDYWTGDVMSFPTQGSYADPTAHIETTHEHAWNHGLGEIVTALARAGLRLESLREHPWVEWPFEGLVEDDQGRWRLPESQEGSLPFWFTLLASQPS